MPPMYSASTGRIRLRASSRSFETNAVTFGAIAYLLLFEYLRTPSERRQPTLLVGLGFALTRRHSTGNGGE